MLGIIIDGSTTNETYLSYQWLMEQGVPEKSIQNWSVRKLGVYKTFDGSVYIEYNSIPAPSRKKLPTREAIRKLYFDYHKNSEHRYLTDKCHYELYKSYTLEWSEYRQIYDNLGLDIEKATAYAKEHAVWVRILELRFDRRDYRPRNIHEAYKRIFPKGYAYAYMSQAYRIAKENGIPALLVKYTTRKGNTYAKRFGKEHEGFVLAWMSSGKAYSAVTIHDELYNYCKEHDLPIPGYTWVKSCVAKFKQLVEKERYGESSYISNTEAYAGIIKALNPNSQWQMDGWRLPFYMKGYETLNLYAVMDSHSGYIIDYDIAPTENTENILKALSLAVEATGCLPFEIVTDNHSFNQTKEAEYLKTHTDKLGMTWTVDSNPRRKGVIERSLGVFGDKFMKGYPGYIGSGIKSKSKDAHVSQEERDKYQKANTWITENEIRAYAVLCVNAYNNYVAKKDLGKKKSRKELFANPDQPHKIPVTLEDRLRLFIRESEYKVQRGQINIKRDLQLHEYQLNSELITKYNGKYLRVRYESFDEIFLFDIDTDECLGSVKPKRMAHGALADQTEEDIKIFNQHKGRLAGVKNQIYKEQMRIIDPDAYERVNHMVGKKIDLEALRQNGELQREFLTHGVNFDLLRDRTNTNESNVLKPKAKKTKRDQPFASKEKTVKTFKLSEAKEEALEASQPLHKSATPNVRKI